MPLWRLVVLLHFCLLLIQYVYLLISVKQKRQHYANTKSSCERR